MIRNMDMLIVLLFLFFYGLQPGTDCIKENTFRIPANKSSIIVSEVFKNYKSNKTVLRKINPEGQSAKAVFNGGVIGYNQSHCGPFTPSYLTSICGAFSGIPGATISYQWLKSFVNVPYTNGSPFWTIIPGAHGAGYQPGMVTQTTYYIRKATVSAFEICAGTGKSNIICVTVDQAPVVNIALTGDTAFCAGDTVVLTALSVPGSSFQWSTGSSSNSIIINQAGSYMVTVTSPGGCTAAATPVVLHTLALPSDLNRDGITNICDILLLLQEWNMTCGNCTADINSDLVVDIRDFLIILAQFDMTCQQGVFLIPELFH